MSDNWVMILSLIGGYDLGMLIVCVWMVITEPPISDWERLPTIIYTAPPSIIELDADALRQGAKRSNSSGA